MRHSPPQRSTDSQQPINPYAYPGAPGRGKGPTAREQDGVPFEETTEDEPLVDMPLACARCDFELEGLEVSARCPNCGLRVVESLRDDLLREMAPAWLDSAMTGLRTMQWAIIGVFYVVVANVLATWTGILPLRLVGIGLALGLLIMMWWGLGKVARREILRPHADDGSAEDDRVETLALAPNSIPGVEPTHHAPMVSPVVFRGIGHAMVALGVAAAAGIAFVPSVWSWPLAALVAVVGCLIMAYLGVVLLQQLAMRIPDRVIWVSSMMFLAAAAGCVLLPAYLLFWPLGGGPPIAIERLPTDHQVLLSFMLIAPVILAVWAAALMASGAHAIEGVYKRTQGLEAPVEAVM